MATHKASRPSRQQLNAPLHILLIEDDEGDRDLAMAYLSADDSKVYQVTCADSLETGLDKLKSKVFDAIILDLVLPDSRGVATVTKLCNHAQGIPVVVSSYFDENALAHKVIELGAQDYLPKDKMDAESLSRLLNRSLARAQHQSKQLSAARFSERKNNPLSQKIEQLQGSICRLETLASDINSDSGNPQSAGRIRQRMITTLSHECRSPATAILLATNILKSHRQPLSEDRYLSVVNRIEDAVRQLMHLIDTALGFKNTPLLATGTSPEIVDLQRLCQESITQLASTLTPQFQITAAQITTEYVGDCGAVSLYKEVIQQILQQLLTNAIIYSLPPAQIKLAVRHEKSRVRLEVSDQGIGIPEDEQSNVFEAFYRLSYVENIHGLGLGLTIVKTCVDLCGGTVALESERDQGTTVVVELPTG